MSYTFYLSIKTGPNNSVTAWESNYTSNVSGMWQKALGYPISEIYGFKASKCVKELTRAIKAMKDNPDEYRIMNPKNGWGNYEGALRVLEEMLRNCKENPRCKLFIFN